MKKISVLIGLGMTAAMFVAGLLLQPRMPEKMPMHWNASGQVDRYGSQTEALFFTPAVALFVLLLMWGLPKLSPKGKGVEAFQAQYDTVALVIIGFMGAVHLVTILASFQKINVGALIIAGASLLFVAIGNVLGKTTRNYWMGIRTPWTLESDSVWEKTHRMAAKTMVGGGLIGMVLSFTPWPITAIIPILVGTFYPVIYSYQVYKQEKNSGEGQAPSSV